MGRSPWTLSGWQRPLSCCSGPGRLLRKTCTPHGSPGHPAREMPAGGAGAAGGPLGPVNCRDLADAQGWVCGGCSPAWLCSVSRRVLPQLPEPPLPCPHLRLRVP